jgi:hypothetical protein
LRLAHQQRAREAAADELAVEQMIARNLQEHGA